MASTDPLGVESWRSLGIEPDVSLASVSIAEAPDEQHRYPYRPTVDGNSDDLVYIDHSCVLVTAHDTVKIHGFVRELRRRRAAAAAEEVG